MPEVYCVRAEFGTYTNHFVKGAYAAIGWISEVDLTSVKSKDELYPIYKKSHPDDTSNIVIGQQVGQIARFLLDIQAGDFVITPDSDTEFLHVGVVEPSPSYFFSDGSDGCPFRHRRLVKWLAGTFKRSAFSVPFQNTIRSSLTVFYVSQKEHFFEVIGKKELVPHAPKESYDPYRAVLDQLLELNDKEFEILITHLLAAIGFEGAEHTGKTGDGGVDATGELNVANLAKMKLFVQVKCYKLGTKIAARDVRALRQSIPSGGQGAFITTADFQGAASDIALEQGFPRIGLVNGRHPAMQNPTLVVLTDWNDLDDQLFGQFQRCSDILGQTPVQASGREHLRELLNRASGGVVFTTIHKFMPEKGEAMPELSARQNIVVIADEAHRSQYGFGGKVNEKTGEMSYGFASNLRDALPNASFIGFTGTPIEKTDANTRAVFGDYISIYDIQRAVADKATVPIYYESRISKLSLNAAELPKLDAEFEEITEGEELTKKEKLKTKWAALEALVGDPKRIALVAADLVAHFEKRVEAMDGKAMIVCMSRRICVDLYNALIALRPDWASAKDDDAEAEKGKACVVKVVMTGSAEDGPDWQPHIRSKKQRRDLANQFKDAKNPFKIVIVRDMWLTGFDAPCLHTMYADKPMQGHGLMQAIARVNRVFRDKPGGLVVDYLGLADQLKKALITYTESGGQGDPTFDTAQAIAVMLEKHGIACDLMHGFDWDKWTTGKPAERLALIPAGQEHILQQDNGKKRWLQVVSELSRAFALCAASDEATEIRDDVSFFQALQAALSKQTTNHKKTPEQIDAAIRQLVSKAITTEGQVIDVFTAAGLPKPDISILSDQFLAEVRGLKHKNVAAELLEKLLKDELKVRSRRNLVQSQVFSEKLKKTLNAYHNRAISTMEVIEELIQLAKDSTPPRKRARRWG